MTSLQRTLWQCIYWQELCLYCDKQLLEKNFAVWIKLIGISSCGWGFKPLGFEFAPTLHCLARLSWIKSDVLIHVKLIMTWDLKFWEYISSKCSPETQSLHRLSQMMLNACMFEAQVNLTQIWLTISSLLLSFVFVFGNSIRTIYESALFLFVVHPFDVGDQVLIGPNTDLCTVRSCDRKSSDSNGVLSSRRIFGILLPCLLQQSNYLKPLITCPRFQSSLFRKLFVHFPFATSSVSWISSAMR